jgi:predicted nucleotide-binding protein (sugar kinase/HSP70/actin superfamily)
MNKVCAAGTGSFLEEQARDLGIDVHGQFSDCAFAGSAPLDLGSRCTVFMETEVVAAQARGGSVENLCAGLAYSIARNYLDKVVGHRALGRNIVFQGGVASNTAVVAAFEAILGTSVQVHPYNRISGAIGAALAARMARPAQTRFKGLTQATVPRLTCFECQQCSNRCEVNVIETGEGERAFFGDTCERYTSGPANRVCTVPDLAGEYLEHCEALFASAPSCGLRIGVPRASSLMGDLPFWASFWGQLGHQPVLSPPSSAETLATGLKHLSVGVCLPIKLLAGHVHALLEQDVDMVFLPASMDLAGADPEHAHACPYTMAAPFIVGATDGERCLTPVLRFHSEDAFVDAFEPVRSRIGAQREQIRSAFRIAVQVQLETLTAFRTRTRELLDARGYSHAFAILARPYSTLDRFVNLALFERLRRLNVLAIPMAFLPRTEPASVGAELPWHYPEEICRAGRALDATPRIDPVVLSSYGCGPDAFTLQRLAEILGGRPYLVLELDEHRGDAGMMTRVEAFLDQLQAVPTSHTHRPERVPSSNWVPRDPAVIWIPRFADHAYAYSGLLRHLGHDPRVLPLPDREAQALGERHALGKECHPYSMILGDLLQLAGRPDTRDSVFFFPGTSIPCLLHEYGSGMQTLLRDLGIRHIRVSSPTGASLMEAVGLKPLERFYTGLLAIELLVKAVCQTRPYERNRGETDRVHQENLDRIETAIAGGDVLKALGQSLRDLGGITTDPTRDRPKVGLVGDLYTRVNPAANQELVRWFEDEGLEVWPSPFQIDLVDHGISRNFYESLTTLGLPNLVANGSIALLRAIDLWRVRNVVGSRISHRDEPGLLQARRLAAPYMPNEDHELLFLQVAKTADFARSGVNGVVNAICFGCMVGNAAAALNERIRRDHDHLPILTAVYSGGGSPARTMALEAFVSQVKAHHRRAART